MSLTLSDVTQIARLSRIELSGTEADATLHQLNSIFAVIEQMQAIDTTDVSPLTTPLAAIAEVDLRLRDDEVTEGDCREAFQQSAPATAEGLYLVPRVFE